MFGRKSKLQVDLSEAKEEKEHLTDFLKATLKVPLNAVGDRLTVESDKLSPQELQKIVTKFIYKRNLNSAYYVSLEGTLARVTCFKGVEPRKHEKEKKNSLHQTAAQSWGL